jgi:hypothetical protein
MFSHFLVPEFVGGFGHGHPIVISFFARDYTGICGCIFFTQYGTLSLDACQFSPDKSSLRLPRMRKYPKLVSL